METIISTLFYLDCKYQFRTLFFNFHNLAKCDLTWLPPESDIIAPNKLWPRIIQNFLIKQKLREVAQNNKVPLIICTDEKACKLAHEAFRSSDIKLVSWLHRSIDTFKGQGIFAYMDGHIAISKGIERQLFDLLGRSDNIYLLQNCLPKKLKCRIFSRDRNLPPVFIYVGRVELDGAKRLNDLLTAFSMVKNDEVQLHVIGDGQIEECIELCNKLGIEEKVFFDGWQRDPWEFCLQRFKNIAALCLTSAYEGFPMVLVEAVSQGLFCISSNCRTGPDEIINKNNGILFNVGDARALSECMQVAIDNDAAPDLISKTADKFSYKSYENKLNKIINSLLNR